MFVILLTLAQIAFLVAHYTSYYVFTPVWLLFVPTIALVVYSVVAFVIFLTFFKMGAKLFRGPK